MENLEEPRSHSSATATRLISQMKITKTRDEMATGLANPSAMRNVSIRKNATPTISAQFRLISAQLKLVGTQFRPAPRPWGARSGGWSTTSGASAVI